MNKIPFIQGEAPNVTFPLNLYFQPEGLSGKNAMMATPGLTARVTSHVAQVVRGAVTDKNRDFLYVVVGSLVYCVDKNWVSIEAVGTIDTSTGPVYMSANLTQIMIVDGVAGYIVTKSGIVVTVTKETDAGFVVPGTITFQDNYFIVNKKDSFYFQISSLSDGLVWDALDLGSAEGNPDNILRVISDHRQLFLFGSSSAEIFYNSGNATFPFERFPDVFIEGGIDAPQSLTIADNSLVYLDDTKIVRRLDGFVPKVLLQSQFNKLVSEFAVTSDMIGFTYTDRGNIFYVMTFPSVDKTYVYNFATGFIHQWSSGLTGGRHRSNCCVFFNDKYVVGDYENGILYTLENDVYTDNGSTIVWKYISSDYAMGNNMLFHKELQIGFDVGVGLVSGQGEDPQIMLRYSDNGMKTWSNEIWRSLGKLGEYKTRVRFTRLGGSRTRRYELSGSDPVPRSFYEANIDLGGIPRG